MHWVPLPCIDRKNVRTGKGAEDEDIKLKDAVQLGCNRRAGSESNVKSVLHEMDEKSGP